MKTSERFEVHQEVWKPAVGFESFYEVSNLGGLKSLKGGRESVLTPFVNSMGYVQCVLTGQKKKTVRLHRVIAQTFIPNPENKPEVNHINGVKDDNRIINLEWCTSKENSRHLFDVLKRTNPKGVLHPGAKIDDFMAIVIYTESGSIKEIAKKYSVSSLIVRDIRNGITWKHITKNLPCPAKRAKNYHVAKPVEQWSLDGKLIKRFEKVSEVKAFGFNNTCVIRCAKGFRKEHRGYVWKYSNSNH